jgi:hypothetical protein
MHRRGFAWLLALPLITAGSLVVHTLAYRIVEPSADLRGELLAATGHGYFAAAPFVVGISLAFLLVGVGAAGWRAWRGKAATRPLAWPIALLPLVAFAFQEHLERFAATGSFPLDAATEPTFLVGLALQLPFALLALLAARWLARAAEAVGAALRRQPPPCRAAAPPLFPIAALAAPIPAPALRRSVRGPPRSR